MGGDKSVSWLLFEGLVQKEKQDENAAPCSTLAEVRRMLTEQCGIRDEKEQDEVLEFFHRNTSIMHFNQPGLRELVIKKPQWMFNALATLITDRPKFIGLSDTDFRGLPEEAVLDPVRWDRLWKEHISPVNAELPGRLEVLRILVRFSLLAHMGDGRYLIPAMLPEKSIEQLGWQQQQSDLEFSFDFGSSVPDVGTLFSQLMAKTVARVGQAGCHGLSLGGSHFQFQAVRFLMCHESQSSSIAVCVAREEGVANELQAAIVVLLQKDIASAAHITRLHAANTSFNTIVQFEIRPVEAKEHIESLLLPLVRSRQCMLECPMCRQLTQLPTGEVTDMPCIRSTENWVEADQCPACWESFEVGYVFDCGHMLCVECSPKHKEAAAKPWQPGEADDAAVAGQLNNSIAQPGGGDEPPPPEKHAGCQTLWVLGDGAAKVTLELSEGAFVDQPLQLLLEDSVCSVQVAGEEYCVQL